MNSEKPDKNNRAIKVFDDYRDLIQQVAEILGSFDILPAQKLIDDIEALLPQLGEFKDDILSTETFQLAEEHLNELLEKLRGNPGWNNVFDNTTQKTVNLWEVLRQIEVDPFDRGSSS